MKKSVEIEVFKVMLEALRPTYLDGTMNHLSPAARGRVKRTMSFHALAKKLRDAGAPEIKLSVFEVDDESFNAALASAGIDWLTETAKPHSITFSWDAQSEHVDAVG
jgi:hypothetical protein